MEIVNTTTCENYLIRNKILMVKLHLTDIDITIIRKSSLEAGALKVWFVPTACDIGRVSRDLSFSIPLDHM